MAATSKTNAILISLRFYCFSLVAEEILQPPRIDQARPPPDCFPEQYLIIPALWSQKIIALIKGAGKKARGSPFADMVAEQISRANPELPSPVFASVN